MQCLSDEDVIAMLDELALGSGLAGFTLADTQARLPVVFDGVHFGVPHDGMPSSHLLKPAVHGLEGSVFNEGFCMALALATGLRPAIAKVHAMKGRSFVLAERCDRFVDEQGGRRRLPMKDFCQALGVPSEIKYQTQGGPDLAQCFALLRKATHPSTPQILRFLDYVIFNALIGNDDAHGKSFSLLYFGKDAVLAPLHDVLSTAIYPDLRSGMAMKIGSIHRFSEARASDWEQFAQEAGLGKELVKKRMLEMAGELAPAARKLEANGVQGFAGSAVVARIVALIEQRCAQAINSYEGTA